MSRVGQYLPDARAARTCPASVERDNADAKPIHHLASEFGHGRGSNHLSPTPRSGFCRMTPKHTNSTHKLPLPHNDDGPRKTLAPLVISGDSSMPRCEPLPHMSAAAAPPTLTGGGRGAAHPRLDDSAGGIMNLAAFPASPSPATPAGRGLLPEMPLNPSSAFSSSLLRRSLRASLRRISPMASAAAPTSAPAAAAENGAAKAAEQQPVQVGALALFTWLIGFLLL